jgi:CRP-like cAMP-binding protein
LHPLKIDKIERIPTMATNFANVTNTAPRVPLGFPLPSPTAPYRGLKLVAKTTSTLPISAAAFNLQYLLDKFMPGKSRRDYQPEESVFSQGDSSNAVFYIQSGKVTLSVVSTSGKEAVIAHLQAGSFFGEGALVGEKQRTSSAITLESATIVRFEKMAMQGLLAQEAAFAEFFRTHLLARHLRMQADFVDHLFNSSEKRLARLLMLMANFGQDSKPVPAIAKISQETLAEMIGTTRSRVSLFLNRFRTLGYISYNSEGMLIKSSLVNIVLEG